MLLFAVGVGLWYAEKNQARIERADQMTTEEYRDALVEEQRDKMKKRSTAWPAAMGIMALVWCVFYLPYELLCWLTCRGIRRARTYLEARRWNR